MPEWWGGEVSDNKEYEGMVEALTSGEVPPDWWQGVRQDIAQLGFKKALHPVWLNLSRGQGSGNRSR